MLTQYSPEVEPAEVEVEGAEEGHECEDVALAEGLGAAAGQQPLGHHGANVRRGIQLSDKTIDISSSSSFVANAPI